MILPAADELLAPVMAIDGFRLACLIDGSTGMVLATREFLRGSSGPAPPTAAAGAADVINALTLMNGRLATGEHLEDVMVTFSDSFFMVRPVGHRSAAADPAPRHRGPPADESGDGAPLASAISARASPREPVGRRPGAAAGRHGPARENSGRIREPDRGAAAQAGRHASTGMLPMSGPGDGAIFFCGGQVVYAESTRTPPPPAASGPGRARFHGPRRPPRLDRLRLPWHRVERGRPGRGAVD